MAERLRLFRKQPHRNSRRALRQLVGAFDDGVERSAQDLPPLPGGTVGPVLSGVYGGVESELTKKIALDADARYEHYSDFGQSLIGKAAGRVTVADGLALRGAVSTGFRAPSLQQLWFSNVTTQFLPDATGALQPTQVLTSNNASPVTRAMNQKPQGCTALEALPAKYPQASPSVLGQAKAARKAAGCK